MKKRILGVTQNPAERVLAHTSWGVKECTGHAHPTRPITTNSQIRPLFYYVFSLLLHSFACPVWEVVQKQTSHKLKFAEETISTDNETVT